VGSRQRARIQFKARLMKTVPPTTVEGIERYLSSALVKGIGRVLAKKLVGRFGPVCREQAMSPEQRLVYHQTRSGPLMQKLEEWFREQFAERKVEPNSGLGQAITYMQNHWAKLTLFLRQPAALLDNNVCGRALEKAILHRKNALFYKTQNGAHVGDLFMSLIYTCQLCGANVFAYLTELQQHGESLARSPQQWMPWNYRDYLTPDPGTGTGVYDDPSGP